jgi:hypothetical protein
MEFRLTYDGPLRAAGNNSNRKEQKHEIRMSLHPQLCQLWRTHPGLKQLQGIWQQKCLITRESWSFLPLVTSQRSLHCHLTILFLRPGSPGKLICDGGDIDNRLKTLFDALRAPKSSELPCTNPPGGGVICVLLEEDSLITGFDVETDQLLGGEAGGGPAKDSSHVRLVIQVSVKNAQSVMGYGLLA